MSTKKLSRRDFLVSGTGAAAVGLLAGGGGLAEGKVDKHSGRVVLVRDQKVLGDDGQPDPMILHDMLNRGVASLLEEEDSAAAWRRLISSADVVGIKSNVWNYLPTPPALEEAIRSEVLRVGVKADDVAVDDRGVRSNPVFRRATAMSSTRASS